MKNSNGTLGDGSLAYLKGSGIANSRISRGHSEIQATVRDSSEKFVRQTSFKRNLMYELL
jgi:hypothetical protein